MTTWDPHMTHSSFIPKAYPGTELEVLVFIKIPAYRSSTVMCGEVGPMLSLLSSPGPQSSVAAGSARADRAEEPSRYSEGAEPHLRFGSRG